MKSATLALGVAALGLSMASPAWAVHFDITRLVSDGAVPAKTIDPDLVNPWGVATSATSPFWVADNGTGVSTLYNTAGAKLGLTVTIPGGAPSAPTGMVFNSAAGANAFSVGGAKSAFIFDSEDGIISAWAPSSGTNAAVAVISPIDAIYKGLAIGDDAGQARLYAADFHNGAVEIYDDTFTKTGVLGADPTLASGYAPFNVQVLNGELYVTYAKQDAAGEDEVAGAGLGFVDVFNLDGTFNRRIASEGDAVNAPWGLAIAPSSFGEFAGSLLVGNFGDGTISAFDSTSGDYLGKLLGAHGQPLAIDGLWALIRGNGARGGDLDKIYFTAGLNDEADGLFGALSLVPEPAAWLLMLTGFGLTGALLRRRRAAAA